jgi:hypothetical protein
MAPTTAPSGSRRSADYESTNCHPLRNPGRQPRGGNDGTGNDRGVHGGIRCLISWRTSVKCVDPEPQKGSSTSPFAGQKAAISGFRLSTRLSVG